VGRWDAARAGSALLGLTPTPRRLWRLLGLVLLTFALAGALIGLTEGGGPRIQKGNAEFCFAEWCLQPMSALPGPSGASVVLKVRSDAKSASQRPDHPQVWLVGTQARTSGGPQPALDRLIAAGDSFETTLAFHLSAPGSCPGLLVNEGAWPSFLGLGHASSPFTERVAWRLCDIPTGTP
jgi:hypothetical protein